MPKISSYPIISVPGLEDLLIGTDINNLEETKNFRLSDISVLLGSGYVPYTGATGNINLGAFGITANSFIKAGGTSLQFLKADGSSDSTQYTPQSRTITINGISYDLSANRSWNFGGVDVLTTSGFSGPATYVEGFLNIPQYQPAGNYITSLSGEATGSGPGAAAVTLSNSAVIGKLLTGFNVVAGSIISSDSILQAFGKAQSQINALASGVSFRGTWNASTNTPALASGVGTGGHYYVVSVAGSTSLNGVSTWAVGDWVIFNGVSSVWQRIPNTQLVSSVNGFTGAVSLTSSDVGAAPTSRTLTINGTAFDLSANRSWTVGDIRSDQSYGNPSWITSLDWAKVSSRPSTIAGYGITNAALSTTTITINGIGYDLSANRVWSVGTVTSVSVTGPLTGGTITGSGTIGITQAGPTSSGFLSSADWNMFNSKVSSISATLPLSFTSGTISISQAGTSSDGYLSQSDWNSFNQKQDAIVNPITGIGSSGFLPMFTGPGDLSDSPISYSSNSLLVNYSSTIGNSFVLENTGIGSYSYSILMNNFAINKSTTHFYSEGLIVDVIGENQVRRVFPNGNTVFGVSTVDNGNKLSVYGTIFSSNIPNAAINTDRFLVSDSGVVKYRTASELFSDIGSSRSITINGVSQDLSSDRSWSVGTVTSVSVSAPVGFTVAGSPITGSGTIAIAFASGYSLPTNGAQSSWDIAYNNMIVSAAVTGTTTKTLTLNQQDGGTVTASWVESGGGGTPGGSNTQVQFNNSGSFGGSSDFTWDNTSKILSINGAGVVQRINGTTFNSAYLDFQSAGVTQWRIGNTSSPSGFSIIDSSNNTVFGITQSGVFDLSFPTGAQLAINSLGGSGISINPISSGDGFLSFANNAFRIGRIAASDIFVVRQNTTDLFSITSGGRVNIGGNYTSSNNTLQVAGNVSIGYTAAAPSNGIQVSGNALFGTSTDNGVDKLQVSGSGYYNGSGVLGKFDGTSTNNAYIDFRTSGTPKWQLGNNAASSHDFNLTNSATSVNSMVVNSSNQIGFNMQGAFLGANSAFEFHKTSSQFINRYFSWSSAGLGVQNEARSTRSNTYGSYSATLSGDPIYAYVCYGSSNSAHVYGGLFGYYQNGATSTYVPGYWQISASGGSSADRARMIVDGGNDRLEFFTTLTERMRVTPSGRVLMGSTLPADNATDALQVNGSAIATSFKVNTSGQSSLISTYYNGGTGNNIWIGGGGQSSTSTSFSNSSFGKNALLNNTGGSNNTAIGNDALRTNTTGNYNNALGDEALYANTSGSSNDAFGLQALRNNTTGYRNVGFSNSALLSNTTGYENVGIGHQALLANTTGYGNIGIGYESGRYVSGGSANQTSNSSIYIGTNTRSSANGNTNEIVIGTTAIGQGSNTVTLGNSSITKTFLRGNTMVNTTTDNGVDKLQVNGSMIATSLKKSGGTSSQVLYADGSTKQITSGTAAPTGGNNGDIYLQYV